MANLEEPVGKEKIDPFDPQHAPGFSLLMLMRIYDVLLAQLTATNKGFGDAVSAKHEAGRLWSELPWLDPEADVE